jgi:hypothetical protein
MLIVYPDIGFMPGCSPISVFVFVIVTVRADSMLRRLEWVSVSLY